VSKNARRLTIVARLILIDLIIRREDLSKIFDNSLKHLENQG
jgi:hypothetical protein